MNVKEEIKSESESEREWWMKTVSERGMSHNAASKGGVTASNDMCSRVTTVFNKEILIVINILLLHINEYHIIDNTEIPR